MPRQKFIAVCTPFVGKAYHARLHLEWSNALRMLEYPLNTGYCGFFIEDNSDGGFETAQVRNKCVVDALAFETENREVTHLFWIDDDVVVHPSALMALWTHHRPIASGVYFTRSQYPESLIFPAKHGGTSPFVPDQSFETWGHGMGLTLVSTEVYKTMLARGLLADKYGRPAWYVKKGPESAVVEDGVVDAAWTEDLFFLDAAGKLGYKPFVDTSRACFGWHVDRKTGVGYPKPQWEQMMAELPIEWQVPGGKVLWMPDGTTKEIKG